MKAKRLYLGEQPAFYLVSRVGEKLHFRGRKLSCQAGKQFWVSEGEEVKTHRLIMMSPTELKEGVADIVWFVFR